MDSHRTLSSPPPSPPPPPHARNVRFVESMYGGKFTLSIPWIKPKFLYNRNNREGRKQMKTDYIKNTGICGYKTYSNLSPISRYIL